MLEPQTENSVLETWSTPQCPFAIEYSRRVLDDIRLAVMDAFFSLPRGGAEIGGILLGQFENGRLRITDYRPLDCEHALGPSFSLSPKDQECLTELLDRSRKNEPTAQPVGWYHSHTRSEIFLSDADLEIHNRFFPESWQIALVLRPSAMEPTRAGFFFREPGGSISAKASYQEFTLEALPALPVPHGHGAPTASLPQLAAAIAGAEKMVQGPAAQTTPLALPPPEAPAATDEAPPTPAPADPAPADLPFLTEAPARPSRRPLWAAAAIAVVAGAAAFAYQQGAQWLAGLHAPAVPRAARRPSLPPPPAPKQAQASPVASAAKASLPAPPPAASQQLAAEWEKKNAALAKENTAISQQNAALSQQNAAISQENAAISRQNADLRKENDDLTRQLTRLKADFTAASERSRKLAVQLQQQQRKRLENQSFVDPLQ